ncbi:hypothetical protein PGT21_021517 [Puccinia graminis f. sp. tritici]|uniref:Formin GTPase-binding domain-containing protein n=1 Tax=Puccinia graminis f. sp. tritici TaxID=56615 RepID=A0A5B0PFF4_PUCGR|nr:hypothetical protein PGTUg99_033089 [Puccinia graminis f. sp. tritici]KAA1099813.1 hypothetical protein PGT21_021517 [Puccinia graminis f. sp. tritici]
MFSRHAKKHRHSASLSNNNNSSSSSSRPNSPSPLLQTANNLEGTPTKAAAVSSSSSYITQEELIYHQRKNKSSRSTSITSSTDSHHQHPPSSSSNRNSVNSRSSKRHNSINSLTGGPSIAISSEPHSRPSSYDLMPPPPIPPASSSTTTTTTNTNTRSTSLRRAPYQHLWPRADPNQEKFELLRPRDEWAEQIVNEMFDDMMNRRELASLPASAQQGMLNFSIDKKWTLIYNDRYTGG